MFHRPSHTFATGYPVHPSHNYHHHQQRDSHCAPTCRHSAFAAQSLYAQQPTTCCSEFDTTSLRGCQCSVVDPAEQARERLLVAMKEQQAARKAYADLVAERELARFDQPEPVSGLERGYPRQHQHDVHHELAARAEADAAFQAQQRAKARYEAAAALKAQHEAAIRAKKELIRAHRLNQQQQQAAEAVRRQRELEALHQQQIAAARQQIEAGRRLEQQRRAAVKQREEAESVAQAIALALAFAQQFFPEQAEAPKAVPQQPERAPVDDNARHVRFNPQIQQQRAPTVPAQATRTAIPVIFKIPVPAATVPMASSSKTPVPIRESKGKSSSHVRVNSSSSTSSDVETTTTPADAIAALNLLTADLGDLLAPSHQWYSEAHRRHALNQLLQQVDAVQSGGNETVRDVRRALVRRVERALEGLPDVEEVASLKGKAVEIREPEPEVVAPAPASTVAPEVEGYDIPDFLEAAPASAPNTESEPELAPATSTTAPEEEPLASKPIASPELDAFSASVSQEWSAEDPANPSASNTLLSLTDDAEVEPVAPTAPDITSAPVEPTPANNEGSADPELVPVARTHAPSTPVKKVARGSASDGEDNFELL